MGNGWNWVEYQSLNEDIHTRGKRIEEQIALLRRLWTEPHVDFQGRWHHVPDAGINPLPVQQPIPIWFGGQSEPMIRRAARLGDGWMPLYASAEEARPGIDLLETALAEAGRSRDGFGLEARVPYGTGDPAEWRRLIAGWQSVGATHISLVATRSGLNTPAEHLAALRRFAENVM